MSQAVALEEASFFTESPIVMGGAHGSERSDLSACQNTRAQNRRSGSWWKVVSPNNVPMCAQPRFLLPQCRRSRSTGMGRQRAPMPLCNIIASLPFVVSDRPIPASQVASLDFLKGAVQIYIYGYLNRIQSSRRLEREAQRGILVAGIASADRGVIVGRRIECSKAVGNITDDQLTRRLLRSTTRSP